MLSEELKKKIKDYLLDRSNENPAHLIPKADRKEAFEYARETYKEMGGSNVAELVSKKVLLDTENNLTAFIDAADGIKEYRKAVEAANELREVIRRELMKRGLFGL